MSQVFVLDTERRMLDPIHPGYARWLLTQGKAAVFKRFPFTIILKTAKSETHVTPLRLKIDPGSKTTGIAIVNDASGMVVWAAELTHRGEAVRKRLVERRGVRRSRRHRKTRYRKPRCANRRRKPGWLPPSLASRIANISTWVARLRHLCPIGALSQEFVRFDMQALQNPQISGIEYQQGTLEGYEIREYLLEKWQRRCSYCQVTNVPLQVEHIVPKARGGSNRISNLTLACESCNQAKGKMTATEIGHPEVQAQAKQSLKDAAGVNTTRWALYQALKATGLPVEVGTSGRTKWNRTQRGLPKTHWLDAASVGASTPKILAVGSVVPLCIVATGHGTHQLCGTNKYGFPIRHRQRQKAHYGFQTGDLAQAVVAAGKKSGVYIGRVLVRASGYFDIQTMYGRVQGINHRACAVLHRCDGYSYKKGEREFLPIS